MLTGEVANAGIQLDSDTYAKFPLLNDANKDVFRQLLLSRGIDLILTAQETTEIFQLGSCTDQHRRYFMVVFFAPIFSLIGMIDPREGDTYGYGSFQFNQLSASPREMLKMFHRRSACSCLKGLYYNLKDNTPKMTQCNGCKKVTSAKNIFECDCKMKIYCSRECAKSDWSSHKSECEKYKEGIFY
jgi:hypothetical protein